MQLEATQATRVGARVKFLTEDGASALASNDDERPPAYIEIDGVRQVFGSGNGRRGETAPEVVALESVNLSIERGQFVALVGASGCGKTTLLNMISGLIAPSHGQLTVGGEEPTLPNHDIGYMFARDALLPWRTAIHNVALPLESRGWPRGKRLQQAKEMLKLVGLEGRERQYRLQLSQGMRQRVALARTLSSEPSLLLMDEPFAALDARTKLAMQAEFLRIWEARRESGSQQTVIFVTHDLQEAVLLADRVIVMLPHPGRIAEDRTIDLPRPRADILNKILFTDSFQETARDLFESLEGAMPTSGQEDS